MKHASRLRKPTPTGGPDGNNDEAKPKEPTLPSYVEGRVESVGGGRGLGRDEDPRTGQASGRRERGQQPKGSDQRDSFISSEVAAAAGPLKTTC